MLNAPWKMTHDIEDVHVNTTKFPILEFKEKIDIIIENFLERTNLAKINLLHSVIDIHI